MKYDIYDFDGTIYDGDSGADLVMYVLKKKPLKIFSVIGNGIKYLFKLCSKEEFKSKIFKFVVDTDDLNGLIEDFWLKHERKIKDFWRNKKSHKKDVIISASGYFWLEPIAKKYNVAGLIATNFDTKTGEIIGKNCHGKEKVRLFYENYPKDIINKVYTDSINDLPLIEEAKEGILVKKNKLIPYYEYKPNFFVRFWRWGWGIYHKNEELWNYLIVGGLTTFVSIFVKWGLYFTVFDVNNKLEAQLGVGISWICAVAFAYVANRIYVFKSKNKNIFAEVMQFVGARVLTLLMEMGLTFIFFSLLGLTSNTWVVLVTFIIQILIMILNYVFSKLFVFKRKN